MMESAHLKKKKKWLPELYGIALLAPIVFDLPSGNFNSNLKVLSTYHFMAGTHLKTLHKMIWSSYILISKYISDFCLNIYSGRLLQFVKYTAEMKTTYLKPFFCYRLHLYLPSGSRSIFLHLINRLITILLPFNHELNCYNAEYYVEIAYQKQQFKN